MTTTTTTVNSTVLAADELIAVTGEKSLVKQWALADALLKASPAIQSHELAAVRQAAIDKAGHEEFWQVARLRQLARTAAAWPVASRIADVSLDAHHEAFRASGGNIAGATKVIVDAGKTSKVRGKPSIREIRAAVGANGTTAAPPRVDKADGAELFKRLIPRKKELADYLRKNLRPHAADITAFATLFAEYDKKAKALDASKAKPAEQAPAASTAQVERKRRVKGL
jgi:hypothetical protein